LDIENPSAETCTRKLAQWLGELEVFAAETAGADAKSRKLRELSNMAERPMRDWTGWLGRQDSNLGMAKSKSA
jgi:hypothetical protein